MRRPSRNVLAWLGVGPFLVFSAMFLILPTAFLIVGAFQDANGAFTFANIAGLAHPSILSAYRISLEISIASALGGAAIGFAIAHAAIAGGLPAWIRPTLSTFCGVASQFAGVPLAFAFLATLGRTTPARRSWRSSTPSPSPRPRRSTS
jgi:putative spermidine/putrescine transport system permease protein